MQTTTTSNAGTPDLLSAILSVQVRNEDKITEQDRLYCQTQQDLLYKTLDQIDRWYAIFKEDAEQYKEERKFHYEDNGKLTIRNFYSYYNEKNDYSHNEFKPFDIINELVDKNYNANSNFAGRIIAYFNKTYNVQVPVPSIDEKTLRMGFRPVYESYVDAVIEHLGGKSFRETAEEELLGRFLEVVQPSYWSKVKPEQKKDKITFPEIISFDGFYTENYNRNHVHHNHRGKIETFCEGIAFGADDSIHGSSRMVLGLNEEDIDVSRWYDLTTTNAEQIRFYKNGRIDVRFKDSAAAESCFKRLRLDEITLREQ
ncbi:MULTISPECIES: hypothetical protein [Bacteroides]|uniref:hypothetical protein n=1 Tax=Bacteroides TaxID=816 RepID=UPI00189DCE2D|nr:MULTISPECIES: hypothetical protein [Bacteroides]MDC1767540.1 hypothetical protein [Bacteroides uniformis]MDC1771164.1 hypothetical protein [Bacteroides uniformis]MDC1777124.1 hypothetical protein [Bacteroides uniformis]MDC1778699.1 hypothetical protein [Bacteroides uniformis]